MKAAAAAQSAHRLSVWQDAGQSGCKGQVCGPAARAAATKLPKLMAALRDAPPGLCTEAQPVHTGRFGVPGTCMSAATQQAPRYAGMILGVSRAER